jgi:hypothetical protein
MIIKLNYMNMKNLSLYLLIFIASAVLNSCAEDLLETAPTDSISGEVIFQDANGAQVAVNGIYRALFSNGWSDSWAHENPGMMSLTLVKDLQGEDHLMAGQGNGWFYYDYAFLTDSDHTHISGRQYAQWKLNYTVIGQANYVIAEEEHLTGSGSQGKDVVAQAYALRAFAYTCLYEWFCKGNYPVNQNSPGVPIYTEPTTASTEGKPRGTVAQLFEQINADFQTAVDLFEETDIAQSHPSHLDLYATYALWARVALIQEDWPKAGEYAAAALSKEGLRRVSTVAELGLFNDCKRANILWGFEVIADQTGPFGAYLSHMDPEGAYAAADAYQCIDAWLWSQIPSTDSRKTTWWEHPANFSFWAYNQMKFRYSETSTFLGDIIYLRAEELILIAAEAACRQGHYNEARTLLSELGNKRDSNYAPRLAAYLNSSDYNEDTHGAFTTLMDEILFQRRVELWSEGLGRAFDLRRLNLGYIRNYEGTNHPAKVNLEPGDKRFVTLLPQKEFDGNSALTVADQNPR